MSDGKDEFYGRFHELGTVNMAANPFLRPAFDMKKRKAVAAIAQELRRDIING
jgi:HK97 gp10 family phage protein